MNKQQNKGLGTSSMLDLKAELLRKKEEFQREKVLGPGNRQHHVTKDKKANIWSRSNAGVRERAERDLEAKKEEDDVLANSKKKLEAKARAYEKLASGSIMPDEDINQRFLVDFERKALDKLIERKHQAESEIDQQLNYDRNKSDPTESDAATEEKLPEPADSSEEWVDYVDALGRSRRCMRKDLPELKKMDRELTGRRNLVRDADKMGDNLPELMSDDMYKEKLRAQWEEEERRNMEQPESHYANVQFDEVRDHGVAFYQFDKDAEVRKQQMDKLAALREKTKQNRDAQQQLKKKRKAMMAARLAKVRQRKLIREGKDPSEIPDLQEFLEVSDSDDDEFDLNGKPKDEPEATERDDSWRKKAPIREWDQGKEGLEEFLATRTPILSEEAWKEKLRQERPVEFAPPTAYQEEKHLSSAKSKHNLEVKSLFSQSKKLRTGSDNAATGVNEANSSHEQYKPVAVNVEQMLVKIRAEVERGQHAVVGNVTTSGENETAAEHTDLANIPLPPTSSEASPQAETPAIPSGAGSVLGHNVCQGTTETQNYGVQAWGGGTASLPANNFSSFYQTNETSETYDGTQYTQPATDLLPAVSVSHLSSGHPSAVGGSTVPAPSLHEPQPAHYSSGPMKPQAPKARYERVNLHELPLELPEPPAANNIPEYPSQEEVFGPHRKHTETSTSQKVPTEDEAVKLWKRQFENKSKPASLRPDNVPFATSYIQSNSAEEASSDPAVKFDPSKPPPSLA